jgi:hypothetical protein
MRSESTSALGQPSETKPIFWVALDMTWEPLSDWQTPNYSGNRGPWAGGAKSPENSLRPRLKRRYPAAPIPRRRSIHFMLSNEHGHLVLSVSRFG